ncbi:DNA repair protein RadA [Candidatus Gracilibacteria bacterium]|nr:DNA repair protein RadA [Candidatus Gracilibacteria bacterium]NUJ98974.1 DNA repair protein RadA [Candidatus Gracilibacteria bacterium]
MFICTNCGNEYVKWQGQCNFCKEWNTLKEFREEKTSTKTSHTGEKKELQSIEKNLQKEERFITQSSELNNVLGGGITQGSLILLSGEPGIGKSTLALQIAGWLHDKKIIYISGEETASQIFSRAERLGINGHNINILSESNIENILETIKSVEADFVVFDSISVMYSGNIPGISGSINQVKYIGEIIQSFTKNNNISSLLIGHITKDGNLAGPKSLEHLVDTILFFEGERYEDIRILRSLKNRFGDTGEVGIFKMKEKGLEDLKNPGIELLNDKNMHPAIGSSLSITLEGTRPLLIECEALTNYTKFGYPKRSTRGIQTTKLDMLIAILSKYSQVKLDSYDVYTNIARGLKIDDPGIDLSILASIISSKLGKNIIKTRVFIGEVSLTGKIKNVANLEKRIKEAEKIGIQEAIIPNENISYKGKIMLKKIDSIEDLVKIING